MRDYIDKLLNKFGYYKCEMPDGASVTEKEILEMFSDYGENEIFRRFLRDVAASDIRLYFQASNDRDRHIIRGGHRRVFYLMSLIKKANERKAKSRRW